MKSESDKVSYDEHDNTCESSRHERALKIGTALALLVGAAISTALIVYHDFSSVIEAARRIGWALSLTIAISFLGTALHSFGWRVLFRDSRPGLTKLLFIVRWIRDSLNYLLPSAVLGGDIVGVRLLVTRGHDLNTTSAIIVVDKTLEAAGLFFFGLAGTITLLGQGGHYTLAHLALLGLAVIAAMVTALLIAQRWGLLRVVDRAVLKLAGKCGRISTNKGMGIHDTVWAIYADRRRLIISQFLHILGWMAGVLSVWVALHFMGHDIGWQGALIIESLCQMACAAAFVMPASLGAQEAAYMGAGMLLGIPPAVGLALSLVQRFSDVLSGTLGLVTWQGFEGRLLWVRLKAWKHNDGSKPKE